MIRLRLQDQILLVVLAVVIPFATLTFIGVERRVSEEANARLAQELETARSSFDAVHRFRVDELTQTAFLISELPYLKAAIAVYEPSAPAVRKAEQVATIEPAAADIVTGLDIDFLAIVDTQGRVLTALEGDEAVKLTGIERLLDVFRSQSSGAGPVTGSVRIAGQLYQAVMVPIVAGGTLLGRLAIGYRLDDAIANQIRRMTHTEVMIMGGRVPVARCCGLADMNRDPDIVRRAAGLQGLPDTRTPVPLELAGERFLTLWAPIEGPDGTIVGTYVLQKSLDQAQAYVRSVRKLMIAIWGTGLLAALMLSYVVARRLTRPIQRLVAASGRITEGDLEQTVIVSGGEEIETLADSFNRMSFGLKVSHEQIADSNRRLQDRTTELETSHAELLASKRELEKTNHDLRDAQAQLIQAGKMAALGELGAGLAHELAQPLTSVKGFAQITLAKLDPASPHRRSLELIDRSVDHMSRIVSGLKNFARKSKFEFEPVNLNDIVDNTATFMAAQLKRHAIRLDLDLDDNLPFVTGDANQLQQVLTNLIANARDALEGREDAVIRVRTRPVGRGEFVALTVADNGPGIPKDVRDRIFNSFFTTKETGKGTGLGLSITLGIVKNHAGRLKVRSRVGAGASFRIILPVSRVDELSAQLDNQADRAA